MWTIGVIVLTVAGIAFATWKKKELPRSMSAVVYELPSKWRGMWSVWIWAIMVLLSKPLLEAMPTWWEGLIGFALLATIGVIGALPLMPMEVDVERPYESRRERWHMRLSVLAGVISQVCVLRINPWWLMVWVWWIPLSFCTIFFDDKPWWKQIEGVIEGKGMMLVELTAMVTLYGCMLFS